MLVGHFSGALNALPELLPTIGMVHLDVLDHMHALTCHHVGCNLDLACAYCLNNSLSGYRCLVAVHCFQRALSGQEALYMSLTTQHKLSSPNYPIVSNLLVGALLY